MELSRFTVIDSSKVLNKPTYLIQWRGRLEMWLAARYYRNHKEKLVLANAADGKDRMVDRCP